MKTRLIPLYVLTAIGLMLPVSSPAQAANSEAATPLLGVVGATEPAAETTDEEPAVLVDDDDSIIAQTPAEVAAPVAIVETPAEKPAETIAEKPAEVVADTTADTAAPVAEAVPNTTVIESTTTMEMPNSLTAEASTSESGQAIVSLTFDDTAVSEIIKVFRDVTEANIISGSTTNLMKHVSVKLDKVPWHQGLSAILSSCGLSLRESAPGSAIYSVVVTDDVLPILTKTFPLKHASSAEIAAIFNKSGNKPIATAFPSANVVVVKATEQEISECERIIKSIDKSVPQVYIEARFVEMSAAASKELGLRWNSLGGEGFGLNSQNVSFGYDNTRVWGNAAKNTGSDRPLIPAADRTAGSAQTMTWGGVISASNFGLYWNSFAQEDGVSTFSNPKIIVANEREALVDVTTKEPCITVKVTTSDTGSGSRTDVETELVVIPGKKESRDPWVGEAFFSYGITLAVTPRVSSDGLISVNIIPSISSKTGTYSLMSDPTLDSQTIYARYPIIDVQRLNTQFTMTDGATAVIGGLSRSYENNIDSGVPLLRDIPWIGPRVFGWKRRQKEQKEIVIFVTVGVANPEKIPEDLGMPKNAVMSQAVMKGEIKEPAQQPRETLMKLKD
ncbi:MAG: secretin N-terminal domain-containing protein [Kiritimatiellia bacterium]